MWLCRPCRRAFAFYMGYIPTRPTCHTVMTKHYTNGDITVIWKPELCRHSGICARGLPTVFRPRLKPWIDLTPADSATIAAQVERCPSGALSWSRNEPANSSGS